MGPCANGVGTGPTGPAGVTGAVGPTGPAGVTGAVGPTGPAGVTGAVGPTGPAGVTGAVGPTGPAGVTGAVGPTGPAGAPGVTGAVGPTGPAGANGTNGTVGPAGPTGPAGPAGPAGASVGVDSAYAANTSSSVIPVVISGTNVPLPGLQELGTFTTNGNSDAFTVPSTGLYLVSYDIITSPLVGIFSQVSVNGAPRPALTDTVGIDTGTRINRHRQAILPLVAGDTLQLQLGGMLGAVTLQGNSNEPGASMSIVRLK
ncbi:BclA C-terminal domain-containing protein [Xylophilus sp. ASV27]|uniref:BclA C-terminal domain-containing protein n=1 Tax=Xylophilus sp. ASV27 TaxID=2795129 RepID=UPI002729EB11|nr:hypothetical protein [Xylophilus sp. ASV27]